MSAESRGGTQEPWPHTNIFESNYYEDTLTNNIGARKEDSNDPTSLYKYLRQANG
jgi:hypothetical protein